MSILCQGDTHVFQLNSTTCDCGMWGATAQPINPYPLYYPHGYRPAQTTPPAGEAPPVSIVAFKAAQDAGATYLSADGLRAYCERFGGILRADWDGVKWGSWWTCEGLPADVVKM